jgi:hypothetical protein
LERERKDLSKDQRALREFVKDYRSLKKFDNPDDPFDRVYPIESLPSPNFHIEIVRSKPDRLDKPLSGASHGLV